jgi:polysaccharide deacetylase family protein (PEP-CTERM system associated)
MLNILTIDLEEWYHPEYVRKETPPYGNERIQHSLKTTLDLLSARNTKSTFFIVGELAEKHPEIMESIMENNHEIAFHGYHHEPLWKMDPEVYRSELKKFNTLTKEKCVGFRAPSFSLNNKTKWALKILEDAGFKYDSSVFPTKTLLYGVWGAPTRPYKPSHEDIAKEDEHTKLWEFPLLIYSAAGLRIPIAGGFYLRLFPTNLIKRAIRKANRQGFPAVVFVHTWELDPETPRLKIGPYKSFVTYHNIEQTGKKLKSILCDFEFTCFRQYMEENGLT